MRGLYLGSLLLVIGRSLAQSGDPPTMEPPSEECQAEYEKYSSCLMSGDSIMNMMGSKESIQQYCASKEAEECKAYREDILNTDLVCLSTGNMSDGMNGFMLLASKFSYLTYCIKGEDGNYCPLSDYLQENTNSNSVGEDGQLSNELIQIIANDCKDSKCNARMAPIIEIADRFSMMMGGFGKRQFSYTTPAQPYAEYYKEKNCAAIANSASTTNSSSGGSNGSSGGSNGSSGGTSGDSTSSGAPNGSSGGTSGDSTSGGAPSGTSGGTSGDSTSPGAANTTSTDAPAGSKDSAAFTLKKITYSLITMVLLSSTLLLF